MEMQHSDLDLSSVDFEVFYNRHWKLLYATAFSKTDSHQETFDIVQELFINIWEKRNTIKVKGSMEAYLLRSLRNRIYNHFRNNGIKEKIEQDYSRFVDSLASGASELTEHEE